MIDLSRYASDPAFAVTFVISGCQVSAVVSSLSQRQLCTAHGNRLR
jgi:hypothetical protein